VNDTVSIQDHLIKQVIVTRPENQAGALLEQLTLVFDSSIKLKHLPLLQVQACPFVFNQQVEFDGAIFISRNAVDYFYASVESNSISLQDTNTQMLTVGDKTASQLKQFTDKEITFPEQMNAEGLLELPQLQSVKGQKWLVIKGEAGRELIQQTLQKRGAIVTELAVYLRKLPDYTLQKAINQVEQKNSLWVISSAQALDNLFRIQGLAEKPRHQTQLIVTSERLMLLAEQKGFSIKALSTGASDEQLIQCLKNLIVPSSF